MCTPYTRLGAARIAHVGEPGVLEVLHTPPDIVGPPDLDHAGLDGAHASLDRCHGIHPRGGVLLALARAPVARA